VYLARLLQEQGHHPGIASRGHGRSSTGLQWVHAESTAADVGDEPLLLQQRTGLPVCVAARRVDAARALVAAGCDVVLCDDGLQHLALARDLEICVVDGARGFGNGLFVPAGPLREPRSRLRSVDLVVINAAADAPLAADVPIGLQMRLVGELAWPVDASQAPRPLTEFAGTELHAVAAIGNPGRFFTQLRRAGLTPVEHAFTDHHRYTAGDLQFAPGQVLLMTEKDAVKCRSFAVSGHWYVPVEATFDAADTQQLRQRLVTLFRGRDLSP
jgi:tetraacyldisaccharide 4'-kinase